MKKLLSCLASLSIVACVELEKPMAQIHVTGEKRGVLELSKYKEREQLYMRLQEIEDDGTLRDLAYGDLSVNMGARATELLKSMETCPYTESTDYNYLGEEHVYAASIDNYFVLNPSGASSVIADVIPEKGSPRNSFICGNNRDELLFLSTNLISELVDQDGKPIHQLPRSQ